MLVNGGRSGRARVGSFAAAVGVLGLISTLGFGCGSRTSMLDPDVYGVGAENVENGGSINNVTPKPIGTAGKATGGVVLGNGGASSSSGSKGGASGVDPALSIPQCRQYCPGYAAQCQKRLKGQDCLSTCQGELNGSGSTCQMLGILALSCLTPFFSANGGACDPAVNRALTACGPIVDAFEECKTGPATNPAPVGMPTRGDVTSCPSMGGVGGPSPECKMLFSCPNGSYTTYCSSNRQNPAYTDCVCLGPGGTQTMTQLMQSANVCFDAAHVCL